MVLFPRCENGLYVVKYRFHFLLYPMDFFLLHKDHVLLSLVSIQIFIFLSISSSSIGVLYWIHFRIVFSSISLIMLSYISYNTKRLFSINNLIFINNVIWIVFTIFINKSLWKYFCWLTIIFYSLSKSYGIIL